MKVRATEKGYANDRRVAVGTVFEIPDSQRPGAWMEVLEGPAEPQQWQVEPEKKKSDLETLGEVVASLVARVTTLEAAQKRADKPKVRRMQRKQVEEAGE
jgi:hypothetical protein